MYEGDRQLRVPNRVDDSHQYLLDDRGQRVFMLADTAWELIHRLTPDEAAYYLSTRAAQGFTAIQCVLLPELHGLDEPAMIGERPLIDNDPTKPNEAYFAHVDDLVQRMNALGMVAVLLPTWGDKVTKIWGTGPEIFTPDSAREYGRFVGGRYRDAGVFWMIGGDRPVRDESDRHIWRQIALGIRDAGDTHLMTFHAPGFHSSSEYVHQEDWLDVNSMQSGHTGRDQPIERKVRSDLALQPIKPTYNSEPCYEAHPVMRADFGWRPFGGYFSDADVRNAAWRSVFAGACGHTYGAHPVWQMFNPKRPRMNGPVNHPPMPWYEALLLPGARQMRHLAAHFASEADWRPAPRESQCAALESLTTADGRRRSIYLLADLPATYRSAQIRAFTDAANPTSVRWFDPRTGESLTVWRTADLVPPQPELDWVLDVGD